MKQKPPSLSIYISSPFTLHLGLFVYNMSVQQWVISQGFKTCSLNALFLTFIGILTTQCFSWPALGANWKVWFSRRGNLLYGRVATGGYADWWKPRWITKNVVCVKEISPANNVVVPIPPSPALIRTFCCFPNTSPGRCITGIAYRICWVINTIIHIQLCQRVGGWNA